MTHVQPGEGTGRKIKEHGEIDHEYDQVPTAKAKEKAKEAEGVSKSDGGRGRQPPLSLALSPMVATPLASAFKSNQDQAVIPLFLGLQAKLDFWRQIGAARVLLQAIRVGVQAFLCAIPPPQDRPMKQADLPVLQACVMDYLQEGAVIPLSPDLVRGPNTRFQSFPEPKRILPNRG